MIMRNSTTPTMISITNGTITITIITAALNDGEDSTAGVSHVIPSVLLHANKQINTQLKQYNYFY